MQSKTIALNSELVNLIFFRSFPKYVFHALQCFFYLKKVSITNLLGFEQKFAMLQRLAHYILALFCFSYSSLMRIYYAVVVVTIGSHCLRSILQYLGAS